jgi:hypothetical protein
MALSLMKALDLGYFLLVQSSRRRRRRRRRKMLEINLTMMGTREML